MSDHKDKVLLLLTTGMSEADVLAVAQAKLDMTDAQARQAVAEARERITLTADYNRDQELGLAIIQLRECYTKSMAIQDIKVCLAARKELNKLLKLYDARRPAEAKPTDRLTALMQEIETERAAIHAEEGHHENET